EVHLLAAIAQDVVPDGFQAIARDGERHARSHAFHAVAAGDQRAVLGVEAAGVVDALGRGRTAMGREDRQLVLRVLLQQGLVARRQHLLVLAGVLAIDDQAWGFAGVGIGVVHARLVAVRRGGEAAIPA